MKGSRPPKSKPTGNEEKPFDKFRICRQFFVCFKKIRLQNQYCDMYIFFDQIFRNLTEGIMNFLCSKRKNTELIVLHMTETELNTLVTRYFYTLFSENEFRQT